MVARLGWRQLVGGIGHCRMISFEQKKNTLQSAVKLKLCINLYGGCIQVRLMLS
jgi:hypothetical protein